MTSLIAIATHLAIKPSDITRANWESIGAKFPEAKAAAIGNRGRPRTFNGTVQTPEQHKAARLKASRKFRAKQKLEKGKS